jgi:hypothetical protein
MLGAFPRSDPDLITGIFVGVARVVTASRIPPDPYWPDFVQYHSGRPIIHYHSKGCSSQVGGWPKSVSNGARSGWQTVMSGGVASVMR